MKVLVVGGGGREHALAWRLELEGIEVVVAPGNGGTARAIGIGTSDIDRLAEFARQESVALTIVGPEAPLAAGIVDTFHERGLSVFGPTREAARLEWSKAWTKAFLQRNGIATGAADVVDSEVQARRAIARSGLPIVLKADGLAGGKGVFVLTAQAQVDAALDQLFTHFADAAQQVIIEEYLEGPELSLLALTDGEQLALLPPARDYKRLLDDDRGPNTGGMGGQTWPDYATSSLLEEVEQHVLRPTLAGMAAEGHPYRGILYAGLMLTRFGPKVLEFNCRFGDPECQLIMPLLASSLFEACASVAAGKLATNLRWRTERTLGVVLTAEGYPDAARAGDPIEGLDELPAGVLAFHAGTRRDGARLVTAGGRVVTLVGFDPTAVYEAAQRVRFAGKHYRRDIGASVAAPLAS